MQCDLKVAIVCSCFFQLQSFGGCPTPTELINVGEVGLVFPPNAFSIYL